MPAGAGLMARPKPKKSKDSKSTPSDSKKEETSAAAIESSSDDEVASMVEDIGVDNVPGIVDTKCDSANSDWFEEVVNDAMSVEDVTRSEDQDVDWFDEAVGNGAPNSLRNASSCLNFGSFDDADLLKVLPFSENVMELQDTSGEAFVVAESVQPAGMAELYDSGCTNHISPYRNQFENFRPITPRHFRAANKQTFSTTGRGDLIIDVPNGNGVTELRLLDVLYPAEVGYTLVSIG